LDEGWDVLLDAVELGGFFEVGVIIYDLPWNCVRSRLLGSFLNWRSLSRRRLLHHHQSFARHPKTKTIAPVSAISNKASSIGIYFSLGRLPQFQHVLRLSFSLNAMQ